MAAYDVGFRTALPGTEIMRWCRNNLAIPRQDDFYMRHYERPTPRTDTAYYELTVYNEEDIAKLERNADLRVESVELLDALVS